MPWVDIKLWASRGKERQIYKRGIGDRNFYMHVVYGQLCLINQYV